MKLLHVTTIPMSLGFLRGQLGFIKAHGFDVHVVSSPGPALEAFAEQEHVIPHGIPMERRIAPFRDLISIIRLCLLFRRVQPSIVHAHTPKGGLLATIAAWLARTPVRVYHMRGLPFVTATGWRRTILRWSERVSCRLAHSVICVSQSLCEVAIAEGLCASDKIMVFAGGSGNGVDAAKRFNPDFYDNCDVPGQHAGLGTSPDGIVVGFVGRVVRDKGIVELVEAWSQLRERFPNAHMLVIGPFEPQDPLPPSTVTSLTSDPRVHLTGAVEDTAPYYRLMDLVVLPTYREGFPNVLLEAAAMELPVVATRIPGCVDAMQDGVTGTLVPPRDAAALEMAISQYLDDSDLRRCHGRAGRERVLREFRQAVIWEAIYQEYKRLLQTKGIAVPSGAGK